MRYAYCALRNIRFESFASDQQGRRAQVRLTSDRFRAIARQRSRELGPKTETPHICGPLPLCINIVMAALVRACSGRLCLSPPQISLP
jgi:hypothetical protein